MWKLTHLLVFLPIKWRSLSLTGLWGFSETVLWLCLKDNSNVLWINKVNSSPGNRQLAWPLQLDRVSSCKHKIHRTPTPDKVTIIVMQWDKKYTPPSNTGKNRTIKWLTSPSPRATWVTSLCTNHSLCPLPGPMIKNEDTQSPHCLCCLTAPNPEQTPVDNKPLLLAFLRRRGLPQGGPWPLCGK